MTSRTALLATSFAGAAAAIASPHAGAQDERLSLPEQIIVTARKREQPVQNVPVAVSALSAEQLDAAGVETIYDLSRQVPALDALANTSPAQATFRLRRVGNLGNIGTFEPAVGVFVDGAFRLSTAFLANEFFDVERIEVLRGPQGTLYGKSTTAGVVAIHTAPPDDQLGGTAQISVGSVDGATAATSAHVEGLLTGPLSTTLSGSLALSALDEGEAWTSALQSGSEDLNDEHRVGVRGQLRWSVSDALDLRLIVAAMKEDDKQLSEDVTYDANGFVGGTMLTALQAAGVSDICTDNDPRNRRHCLLSGWRSDLDVRELTLLTTYELGIGPTVSAVTSWDEYSFNGTADDTAQLIAPVLRFHNKQATDSFQQDIRIASPSGTPVEWLAGFFYYESTWEQGGGGRHALFLFDESSDDPTLSALHQALFSLTSPLPLATQGQIGTLDAAQKTKYVSVYGATTWRPTDKFAVNAELRWQDERKDAHVVQSTNDPAPSVISLVLSPAAVSARGLKRATDEATWSLTPQWFATDTTMLFATLAHGFKSGGFNVGFGSLPIASREFGDEDIEHFELGIRSELWQSRLLLAANAFHTDYNEYQDAAFVGARFTVGNAEKAELEGLEIEGSALLTPTLTLEFAASYADFSYATNTHGLCYFGRTPDSPTDPTGCDLSGERPINAPLRKTHLGLAYAKPVSFGEVFARLDWSYTSEYNTSFSADPRLKQPVYDWVNVRAGLDWGRYALTLWAENLTDETVVSFDSVLNIYAVDGSHESYLQAPRSFGVSFRARLP